MFLIAEILDVVQIELQKRQACGSFDLRIERFQLYYSKFVVFCRRQNDYIVSFPAESE